MTIFGNAFCKVVVEKGGKPFNVFNYPIFFNSITSVRAEIKMSEIAMIEVKLHPSFDDGIQILKDGLLGLGLGSAKTLPTESKSDRKPTSLDSGAAAPAATTSGALLGSTMSNFATMFVQFQRPGETLSGKPFESRVFAGAVTQPDVTFDGNQFEITMRGYANAIFLAGPEFKTTIKNESILKIITRMAALIDRTIIFDPDDSVTEKLLTETKITGDRSETALATIKWALSHESCEFSTGMGIGNETKDSTILVRQIASMFSAKPVYTFVTRRQIDIENNVFPMTSFGMQGARSLFISGRAFGNYQLGLDSKTKAPIAAVYNSEQVGQSETSTSDTTGIKAKLDEANKPGFHTPVFTRSLAQDNAPQAKTAISQNLALYQAFTFSVEGLPDLAPMQICQIRVADIDELSGVILITKITHIWDGAWITEIEGRMTGGLGTGVKKKLSNVNATPSESSSRTEKKLRNLDA